MTFPSEFRATVRAGLAAHPVGHEYEGDTAFVRGLIAVGASDESIASARAAANCLVGERYLLDDDEGGE